jgi:hypothetical protein
MGSLVLLKKVSETDEMVEYQFDLPASRFNTMRYGVIEFYKLADTYRITKEHELDHNHEIANRALMAILRE